MSDPSTLRPIVDASFDAVVAAPLGSRGLRVSRRSVTLREQDRYYSLKLRIRANQARGECMFSLLGGVAVRRCLPVGPRPGKPYDFGQQTVPWQTINYGFRPDAEATSGRGMITSFEQLSEAMTSERDLFVSQVLDGLRSVEDVLELLWKAFDTRNPHVFHVFQSHYQTRYLVALLADAGDLPRLEEVHRRVAASWSATASDSTKLDWEAFCADMALLGNSGS